MTLDEIDKIFVSQSPDYQHSLEISLVDIRAWKAERDRLLAALEEIANQHVIFTYQPDMYKYWLDLRQIALKALAKEGK